MMMHGIEASSLLMSNGHLSTAASQESEKEIQSSHWDAIKCINELEAELRSVRAAEQQASTRSE